MTGAFAVIEGRDDRRDPWSSVERGDASVACSQYSHSTSILSDPREAVSYTSWQSMFQATLSKA